jgi:phosphate transport system permease protein
MAIRSVATEEAVLRHLRGQKRDWASWIFQGVLLLMLLFSLLILLILLAEVFGGGFSVLRERGGDFLGSGVSTLPERAGVYQGIVGSFLMMVFVVLVSFPLGIGAAVYLEEYAPNTRFSRFVNVNIRNLAGVPSVVYGLLGLAIFVQILGTNRGEGGGLTGGRTIISGGLTLAILVLPIVIITSSEALRAVPLSLREGGYGVGATKWEVTRRLVLPNAVAGILTGTVLSLSRALGETAPLVLVGAFFGTFFTTGDAGFFEKFTTRYTALPQIIFQWRSDAETAFNTKLAAAAIIVLLGVTLLANLAAVLLRNRYEKKW